LTKLILKNTKSFQKRFEKINKEKNFIKNAEKNIFQQKILTIKLKRDLIKINKNQKIVKL
jgi:hypothetical protein